MKCLTEVLDEYRIHYCRHGESKDVRTGWIGLHCPWCGRPDHKLYLGWHLTRHFFTCWSCGYVRTWDTLAEVLHVGKSAAGRLLNGLDRLGREETEERPRGRLVMPSGVGPMQEAHRDYLRSRGFSPERLEQLWGLDGIGIAPRLQWRVFIPIIADGRTVSWTTRAIGDRVEPRYVSANPEEESIPHKTICYGQDYARHAVVVHEGPADVWATGPGAVALMGLTFTPKQLLWLSRIPQRYVCFDAEPAAQRRAQRLIDALSALPGGTASVVLDAKDAGSASPREIRQIRRLLES
jgi:hypothetical protein